MSYPRHHKDGDLLPSGLLAHRLRREGPVTWEVPGPRCMDAPLPVAKEWLNGRI